MKIAALAALLFLAGCRVSPEEWAAAEKLCENNGGVGTAWGDGTAKCKNGAYFSDLGVAKP